MKSQGQQGRMDRQGTDSNLPQNPPKGIWGNPCPLSSSLGPAPSLIQPFPIPRNERELKTNVNILGSPRE